MVTCEGPAVPAAPRHRAPSIPLSRDAMGAFRLRPALFVAALALLAGFAAAGNTDDVVRQLLDLSAPAADWRVALRLGPEDQAPPDDAPIEALAAWWTSTDAGWADDDDDDDDDKDGTSRPSDAVRQRLLGHALAHPTDLPAL